MDGREHEGALVVMNSPGEGVSPAEWGSWYIDVHMPEVLEPGIFTAGTRFERKTGKAPLDATHMALYECPFSTVEDSWISLRTALAKNADPNAPRPASIVALVNTFKVLHASAPANKPTKTALLVNVDYTDDTTIDDFNHWYNNTHISEFLASGAYHSATRYEICVPNPDYGRFLAIYESDLDHEEADRLSKGNKLTPGPEGLKLRNLAHYSRLK